MKTLKAQKLDKALKNEGTHWKDQALHLLSVFVEKERGEFFIEEFKSWALERGLDEPQHYQAWGGLTTGACKHGLITLVRKDAAKSTARTGHDLCVWRRA